MNIHHVNGNKSYPKEFFIFEGNKSPTRSYMLEIEVPNIKLS